MKTPFFLLVLITLIAGSLACKTLTGETETPTVEPTAVVLKPTTQIIQPTAVEVKPTLKPTLKATPKAALATSPSPVPQVVNQPWRIPPMKAALLIANDSTKNLEQDLIDIMDKQARNLAIPKGYFFEIYALPLDMKFPDVRTYYNGLITKKGMTKANDYMDNKGIGLVTWIHSTRKTQKYALQFNPAPDGNYIFIIYSNPQ